MALLDNLLLKIKHKPQPLLNPKNPFLPKNAKKSQKIPPLIIRQLRRKCKKYAKKTSENLVISKKSCTFALAFAQKQGRRSETMVESP